MRKKSILFTPKGLDCLSKRELDEIDPLLTIYTLDDSKNKKATLTNSNINY
jgi:hypothetical protein